MTASFALYPSGDFAAITKSDTLTFTYDSNNVATKCIYVGGTGDVAVKNSLGATITFTAVPAGTYLVCVTNQVLSTGTSATNMIAFF